MSRFLLFILAISVLSCDTADHAGYTRLHDSVHYKRIALGDEKRIINDDSFVSMVVKVSSSNDSLMLEKRIKRVQFMPAEWPADIKKILATASEGEQVMVVGRIKELNASNWFSPVNIGTDTTLIKLHFTIQEVLEAEEVLQIRAEERLMADHEMKGRLDFQNALDSLGFDGDDLHEGIYYRSLSEGKGAKVKSGGTALIDYRTYLTNGRLIDDTFKEEPFEYHVGKPDQVLTGFAQAISLMNEGGKALFVLPYQSAYGEKGSSSGIVPPYAAIIYVAELRQVRN